MLGEQASAADPSRTRVFPRRFSIIAIFVLLSASNAFQWIQYSIIAHIVVHFYGVSYLAVDWTSMIYMITYIPLVLPATWVLDKYGLRVVALLGGFGNALGACIKVVSAWPDGFWLTFIGQAIVGSSQIFILGIPPRLAAVWFGPNEVSTACAAGVFGNQVGAFCVFHFVFVQKANYGRKAFSAGNRCGLFATAAARTHGTARCDRERLSASVYDFSRLQFTCSVSHSFM